MKKRCLLVLFYLSNCSLYDLSSHNNLGSIFIINQVSLISPVSDKPLIADSIPITLKIKSSDEIKDITINGADGFSTNITVLSAVNNFEFNHILSLSNNSDYHTDKGLYSLNVQFTTQSNKTVKSNYTIPIKIKSVHINNVTYPKVKPTGSHWSPNDKITITPANTGADIKNIFITGTITQNDYNLNITKNLYNPISIRIIDIEPEIFKGQVTANIRITSENNGITNIGFTLN